MNEKIIEIIENVLPGIDVEFCEDFFEEGLDSMGVMSIITLLQDTFEFEINPEDITADYFLNFDSVSQLVQKYVE